MKFSTLITAMFVVLFAAQGCDIVNPAENIPTYIQIDSFNFQATPNTGTSSHKITTVWVYLDGRTIGSFDLPAKVPIITDKPGEILVRPGVTFSGLQDVQTIYNFYKSDTMILQPQPGQVIHFTPNTQYVSDSSLNILNQDFETGNPFFKLDGDTGLVITSDPNYVFEGDYAGLIMFNDTQEYSVNLMQTEFLTGSEPFIELNYKNSLPFEIGLQTTNTNGQNVVQYIIGLNPKDDWNKVYIGLQDFVNSFPNRPYRIVIRVFTDGPKNGFVALDNIKAISGL